MTTKMTQGQLLTKYRSCGPHCFRENIFKLFPFISLLPGHVALGNMADYRFTSDCRSRGLEFNDQSWPSPILVWRLIMK